MSTPVTPPSSRRAQFVQTYRMAKKTDRRLGLWTLGAFVLGALLGFFGMWLLPGQGLLQWVFSCLGGFLLGVLFALIVFGRRAQRAAFGQMEGQTGAAASALTLLKRGWKTYPAVGFNKQQDVVHRVVGPPGIVLVGEGNPGRVKQLLATERRRHERVVSDVPVHEVIVGNDEGQVPLPKLVRHVTKLGRSVKPAEITDVVNRLKAIDSVRPNVPLPKGPVPTSMKGMRGNLRGR
ncbi:DUF4191 domain-containing protein [Nocardioides gansuensis]|uniref:DUF4191 domain-containing protein n=1 Tax=Nocardioides gansuensis TaxID=2138300 RepID=A0A2T8F8G5_9ACTN|nr:DUF4191 domain-containing protein [Nocardioides gansuensis]PVG82021.1 DUF4191 domain-containing protein [Nocardioides gansuensis]